MIPLICPFLALIDATNDATNAEYVFICPFLALIDATNAEYVFICLFLALIDATNDATNAVYVFICPFLALIDATNAEHVHALLLHHSLSFRAGHTGRASDTEGQAHTLLLPPPPNVDP